MTGLITQNVITQEEREIVLNLLSLFTLDGKRVDTIATEGQIEIFHCIVFRPSTRAQILCSTQYGKSLFVALACLVVTCIQKEVIAVVAPSAEKAKIIMRYYVQHLGDNELFSSKLEKNTRLDRLRMEESKERIMLNNGGGIFIITANAGNSNKGFEAAMGAGAKIVIQDESGLIPNQIESTIFRMIAGKGEEAFYCKIGNPFYRNHFLASWSNPDYYKIFIDFERGIKEGRYTEEFIEEARSKPLFDILYNCLFPDEEVVDEDGYLPLFSSRAISEAQKMHVIPFGEKRLGADIAEGGDDNAIVFRTKNWMSVIGKFKTADTMMTLGKIISIATQLEVIDENVFVDGIAVGVGVVNRAHEQKYRLNGVKFSEGADDEEQFMNKRAECYWLFSQWLNEGGALAPSLDWQQLLLVKYKVDSKGRIQIIPKDKIKKKLGVSPDVPDAAALTFALHKRVLTKSYEQRRIEKDLLKEFDSRRAKQRQPIHQKGRHVSM